MAVATKISPKTVHLCPIHRDAREAAEKAIRALRDLNEADPYVYVALLRLHMEWDRMLPGVREQLASIRARAHDLKAEAVMAAVPKGKPTEPRTFSEAMAQLQDLDERAALAKKWVNVVRGMFAEDRRAAIMMTADCLDSVFPKAARSEHGSARLLLSRVLEHADGNLTFVLASALSATSPQALEELEHDARAELDIVDEYFDEQLWVAGGRKGPMPKRIYERKFAAGNTSGGAA